MSVIVLLSTYNGEKYLREQLDSLLSQTLLPNKILIRDDGSSDNTISILEEYKKKYSIIDYYQGANLKPAKSFWELIQNSGDYDYYSLCDQDDVWFKTKLENAIKTLEKENDSIPLLYCSKYTLTDKDLNPINSKVSKLYNYTDFPHSLMYHTAPGCTFVFNRATKEKILQYDLNKEYYVIHDAIIHKVVALFGKVILDQDSTMYYRQHSDNAIGMNAGALKTFKTRVHNYTSGRLTHYRSNSAKSLLNVYGKECELNKKHLLELVAFYQENKQYKRELLANQQIKTDTINDLFLYILIFLNYI